MNSIPTEISLPKHVAIIMDGNGRWAAKTGLSRREGHRKGTESVKEAVRFCSERPIPVLSLYAFSTENWNRSKSEVSFLMNLLRGFLEKESQSLLERDIRLRWIGRRDRIPKEIRKLIEQTEQASLQNEGLHLVLALDYGGRDEIVRAAAKAASLALGGEIDRELLESQLDTAGLPDPDLLIRTSGEQRISNFLLYQAAYAEFYFSPKNWPEFDAEEFEKAVNEYSKRTRKFGLTPSAG